VGGLSAGTAASVDAALPTTPDLESELRSPRTPPRARARGWRGVQERCSLGQDDDSFRFTFQTADVRPHSRGTILPEFCVVPREKREQGMPDARCTRGLVCKDVRKKTHTSIQVQRRHSGIPCAMALRLTSRSPRRIGPCCLRHLRIAGSSAPGRADLPSADLTPTVEASGPHDFTVRFGTARQHVPRIAHEP
jgi:hypothetical protein